MDWLGKDTQQNIALDLKDASGEIRYNAQRAGASFAVRRVFDFMTSVFEGIVSDASLFVTGTLGEITSTILGPELARDMGWLASSIGGKVAGVAAVGGAAGITAAFIQVDYLHEQNNIRDFYRDVIAKQQHKDPKDVTTQDMRDAAEHNTVIDEELSRAKRRRNFNIPVAVAATLAAFAMVTIAAPAVLGALGVAGMTGVGGFLAKAAVTLGISLASYYSVKTPMNALGVKKFGTHEHTVSDTLHEISRLQSRGKTIQPEMVLSALAGTDHELKESIVKNYGKEYDQLDAQTKQLVLEKAKKEFPLQDMTDALSEGKLRPQAIAQVAFIRDEWEEHKHVSLRDHFANSAKTVQESPSTYFQERVGRPAGMAESYVQRLTDKLEQKPDQHFLE